MEDVSYVAFLIPKKTPRKTQLVGFHLYLPTGYIDNEPYFCMATEMVADLANKAISQREQAGEHHWIWKNAAKDRAADDVRAPEDQAEASW